MTHACRALAVALTALLVAGSAWAMTPNEAKTALRREAAASGLEAKDVSQAVSTLEQLIAKGLPVDHAYDVVKAAIDEGARGSELAEIARRTPSPATMRDDIASPTHGEFGRGAGSNGAGHEMGPSVGSTMGGRRP